MNTGLYYARIITYKFCNFVYYSRYLNKFITPMFKFSIKNREYIGEWHILHKNLEGRMLFPGKYRRDLALFHLFRPMTFNDCY